MVRTVLRSRASHCVAKSMRATERFLNREVLFSALFVSVVYTTTNVLICFEPGFCYVIQVGLELVIFWSLLRAHWEYRHVPVHLTPEDVNCYLLSVISDFTNQFNFVFCSQ